MSTAPWPCRMRLYLDNYTNALERLNVGTTFINTFLYTALSVVLSLPCFPGRQPGPSPGTGPVFPVHLPLLSPGNPHPFPGPLPAHLYRGLRPPPDQYLLRHHPDVRCHGPLLQHLSDDQLHVPGPRGARGSRPDGRRLDLPNILSESFCRCSSPPSRPWSFSRPSPSGTTTCWRVSS